MRIEKFRQEYPRSVDAEQLIETFGLKQHVGIMLFAIGVAVLRWKES